jgi:hypothetical protein
MNRIGGSESLLGTVADYRETRHVAAQASPSEG